MQDIENMACALSAFPQSQRPLRHMYISLRDWLYYSTSTEDPKDWYNPIQEEKSNHIYSLALGADCSSKACS